MTFKLKSMALALAMTASAFTLSAVQAAEPSTDLDGTDKGSKPHEQTAKERFKALEELALKADNSSEDQATKESVYIDLLINGLNKKSNNNTYQLSTQPSSVQNNGSSEED